MEPKLESPLEKNSAKKEIKEGLSLRVLVADDEEALRQLDQIFLEGMGHKVTAVENGQLLVEELLKKDSAYDLVFSDNTMPLKNGVDALEEIRSNERFKKLPFIIATTDTDGSLKRRIIDSGGFLLAKPFELEDLKSAISRVIEDKV